MGRTGRARRARRATRYAGCCPGSATSHAGSCACSAARTCTVTDSAANRSTARAHSSGFRRGKNRELA